MTLHRIISGGQTGVDRAALDAALESRFPVGGWCPAGRIAEDGPIPDHYPLQELERGGYRQRTRRNVLDSDGTVIIHFGDIRGGTLETRRLCEQLGKPLLLVDGGTHDEQAAAGQIAAFIREHGIWVLNVAGPRASSEPRAYGFTYAVISNLLRLRP